jgi:spore coat protein H
MLEDDRMTKKRGSRTMEMHVGRKPVGWVGAMGWRRPLAVFAGALLMVAFFFGAEALQRVSPSSSSNQPLDSEHIYNLTNVWTIHLKFTSDQWDAMEPKGGGNPFGRGSRGGAPGGQQGESRGLADVFMSQGDFNRDGRISPKEFARLAQEWFRTWDNNGTGKLDESQIRAGLDKIRNPAGGGMAAVLLFPEGKRNGVAYALGLEFEYVHADLEF